ncbi:alpha/beta hydrolase family protein [Yinghuangia sp. ASG 101]|uniref:alpha/beta hydrolase n=1 Tax=Yinghuangia sp. ASG 101 TaxID=2896848 RepID=UPI001E44140A|nr:alpha/beta hydrolase [Yinghuangia sp. ASG 101]UGQ14211.1 alpha/beta hydrolase family protein [Yinghuangia sp. ASG 101]
MVTFDELKDARFESLRTHADAWSRTMRRLDDVARDFELGVCGATESAGWRGDAAGLANPELEAALRRIRIAALEARGVAAELDFAAEALRGAQTRLFGELHLALTDGVQVVGEGTAFRVAEAAPPTGPRDDLEITAVQAKLDGYMRRLQAILNEATAADSRHAAALAGLWPGAVARGDEAALNHAREDLRHTFEAMAPAATAQWWTALTDAQRQAYLDDFPHEIGSMDGLPASVRDRANQTALNARLAELGPLVHGGTATTTQKHEWDNLDKVRQVMALNPTRGPEEQLMLLKFTSEYRDGGAIVAVGNPDTARNTVVMVPGANTTVSGKLDEQVRRATVLQRAANNVTRTPGDAAAVVWLDYDAPEIAPTAFGSAAGTGRAQEGAARLGRFAEGARAAGPANQHLTVSGHSYGSLVVGYAARDKDGLPADDVVLVGSPGVRVGAAEDLHLDPGHVWVGLAEDDVVAPVGGFVHGPLPSESSFGAQVFPTNDGGHFSYWDMKWVDGAWVPDTSLQSQADIVMGKEP